MVPPVDKQSLARFDHLTFADFQRMAGDDSLTPTEKIGFPEAYRAGAEEAILADVAAKLPALAGESRRILDIGPGCSELPRRLIERAGAAGHELVLVDSAEMLAQLPDAPHVVKLPGAFPGTASPSGTFDAILAYSVIHYVFAEADVFGFLDAALGLLAPGGALLVGDVPNVSKRARFFASPAGVEYHRRFMGTDDFPPRALTHPEPGGLDDDVVAALVARARRAGFHADVVPLGADLPLADRREDILVTRP